MKTILDFQHLFKPSVWLKGLFALTIASLWLIISCKDDTISPDVPIVVVGEVTDIDTDGATFHGRIVNEGRGFNELGFVWDESASPGYTSSRKVVPVEKGIRQFSARISADHQSGKEYTVKAYLKTGDKITYSNSVKFTSKGCLPPVITDFSPKSGVRNTEVTIYGKNFSHLVSHNKVMFGDYVASVIASTDTTLYVKIPSDIYFSSKVKITVTVAGKSTTSIEDFEFGGVFIDRFFPKTATCYGKITIYGKNFKLGGYTYVYFRLSDNSNASGAEILRISDTEIEVKVPALSQGLEYYVEVISGQYSARASDLFKMEIPVITSIEPLSGMEGDTLAIKGRGMGINYSYVYLGSNYLIPIMQSDTLIKVIVPSLQSGQYDVWIQNNCNYTAGYPIKVNVVSPWRKLQNIPVSPRIDAICLPIGDNLYIGLGNDMCTTPTDFLNDWWAFNTISEKWTRKADFPGLARGYNVATVHGGQIVIGGGIAEDATILTDFWVYDPNTDIWQMLTSFPYNYGTGSVLYSINNVLYHGMMKAANGYNYGDLFSYNPLNGEWNTASSISNNFYANDVIYFMHENSGYLLYNSDNYWMDLAFISRFDPMNGWERLPELSFNIRKAYNDDNDIVFIEEFNRPTLFDPSNWTILQTLPDIDLEGDRDHYFGAIANNRIYIGLGTNPNNGNCYTDIIYLDLNDYK